MHALIRAQSSDGGLITLDNGAGIIHDFDEERYAEIFDAMAPAISPAMALLRGTSIDTNQLQSFLVNQLAFTEATVYKKEFQIRTFREVMPIKADGGMWANEIRYQKSQRTGKGRRINHQAGDIPRADVEYGDRSVPVYDGGIGYGYSIKELAQSVALGRSLPADRADAAMEGFEDHINDVALLGESPLPSFFAFSGIPVVTVTGTGWTGLTGYQLAAQMMAQVVTYNKQTGQNSWPDTIVLPVDRIDVLNKPLGSYNDTTVMEYFLRNNLAKKLGGIDIKVIQVPQSTGAGGSSLDRMVLYRKTPDLLRFNLPVPLMFLAPQLNGLMVDVPGFYRYGGVEFTRPNHALYVDFPALNAA